MSRSVKEWIGKTDDTAAPPRVRDRVFTTKDRRCHACNRQVPETGETWTCEHLIAIINGGANRESNLGVTCCNCLPAKNAADVAQKSLVARKRKKARGIKARKGRPMMGTIASGWKKGFDGQPVRR